MVFAYGKIIPNDFHSIQRIVNIMSKIKKVIIIFCLFIVVGCQNNVFDENSIKENYYISFTVTKKEKNKLNMYIYTYDLKNNEIQCKDKIPYTSQYPLGIYDKKRNQIFYSSKVNGTNDELFVKDLETKETKQITDSFFAINYIFPLENGIYIAAVEKGERAINLFLYKNGKLSRVIDDKDLFISQIHLNPKLNKLIFSSYSQSQLDALMEKNDEEEEVPNMIYLYDLYSNNIKKILKNENYVYFVCLGNDEKVYLKTDQTYNYDRHLDKTEYDNLGISEMVYLDNESLYYINEERTKLLKYDLNDKKEIVLYENDIKESAINNATILKN